MIYTSMHYGHNWFITQKGPLGKGLDLRLMYLGGWTWDIRKDELLSVKPDWEKATRYRVHMLVKYIFEYSDLRPEALR
jgi:hypothetical protein